MLTTQDHQKLIRCTHDIEFLTRHLRELVESANPLLSDVALELLKQSVEIERRLSRLELLTRPEEKVAA